MGDHNNDPWQPGGSAWLTITAMIAAIAAISTLNGLFDPPRPSPHAALFAEAASHGPYGGPFE